MFGRTAEELTSIPIAELTHPDDLDLTEPCLRAVHEQGAPQRIQKRYLHKSGRTIWVTVSFSVVHDERGEPAHFISQIEDISARLESDKALLDAFETDLAATERMNKLVKMRAEMTSTVSHELRTPLTSAAGYVELLAEGDAGPLTAEQRMMLDTVSRSLARLDGIVDDVLSMANDEDPKPVLDDLVTDLSLVLQAALETLSLQAASHGLDIIVQDDLDGAEVAADPGRIERVLVNLLTNAVKFTGDDGVITVTAARTADRATIAIADNGIGIAKEEQARIFERFYRADNGPDQKTIGTGLGLAIVHAITTQYGGTIYGGQRARQRIDVHPHPSATTPTVKRPWLEYLSSTTTTTSPHSSVSSSNSTGTPSPSNPTAIAGWRTCSRIRLTCSSSTGRCPASPDPRSVPNCAPTRRSTASG